jgi:transcriptional regulator with XRE-family HTH domain
MLLFNNNPFVRYIELVSSIMPRSASVKPAAAPSATAPHPPRVGAALAGLRQSRGLSLDELSRLAGVSKSMLSQIERHQANPTVAVVWRLATALGVGVGELLGGGRPAAPLLTTVPAHATPTLASPDGKCELRILGPIELAGQFEWYALTVQPGGTLASQPHEPGSREHLSVLAGALDVQAGAETTRVRHGETARYAADAPHRIHNPGRSVAQALLVVLHRT